MQRRHIELRAKAYLASLREATQEMEEVGTAAVSEDPEGSLQGKALLSFPPLPSLSEVGMLMKT